VKAASARLIPSDADPGATEADVVAFIDAQLAKGHIGSFKGEIRAGLRQMDVLAHRAGSASFAQAAPALQDDVLRQLQHGMRLEGRWSSRHFFLVLLTLTLEGFLCDPVYGGNRDKMGWRFIGFEPRPPHPRCPYRGRA
jgi:gluconate 2-dehydrogenase gamma chain